jgi:hypothetical protein
MAHRRTATDTKFAVTGTDNSRTQVTRENKAIGISAVHSSHGGCNGRPSGRHYSEAHLICVIIAGPVDIEDTWPNNVDCAENALALVHHRVRLFQMKPINVSRNLMHS